MIFWPKSLPTFFQVNRYSEQLPDNLQRTVILKGGPEPTRRVTTSNPRILTGNFTMIGSQIVTLESFYNTTLGFGSLSFYMSYFLKKTKTLAYYPTKFNSVPKWKYIGPDSWLVALMIEAYVNHEPLPESTVKDNIGGGVETAAGGIENG